MKDMVCQYCKDEFCVNDQCPMRADYCPVPNTPGVCKHEKRVPNKPLTVQQCIASAFEDCGQEMRESEIKEFFESLLIILDENDWVISPKQPRGTANSESVDVELDITKENEKWHPGDIVTISEVANSHDWVFDHKTKVHDIHESIVYVTRDQLLTVSFDDNNDRGVIMLNKEKRSSTNCRDIDVGQEVSLVDIERSDDWKLKSMASSPFDTSCSYVSTNDQFVVEFGHQEGVGIVKAQYQPGMSVHVGRIGASPYWQCAGSASDLAIYATKDRSLFVAFKQNSDWGVIKSSIVDMLL